MTLGIILPVGDSFKNMKKSGQDVRFKRFYLPAFSKEFEKVIIFSYENEKVEDLPKNIEVVPNKYSLHRFLYAIILPFLNIDKIQKCDVLRVYHLFGTPPAIIARLFIGKPYIFNYAYDYKKFAQIEGKWLQNLLIFVLEPIAILFSKKIFAANKIILKKLSRKKAVYLPNGVDTNFFKPTKKKKRNKIPIILSVGRLEKQKNFEVLVEAMEGISAKLLIVGQGSQKEKLKKLAKKLDVDLKIIEKVENTKMPQIYNSGDIFVLPSLAEGSPKVLLEAMACGLPALATEVEGLRDIIRDREEGFLCGENSRSIKNVILRLLKDQILTDRIAKNAVVKVLKEFNLVKMLKKELMSIKG